MGVALGKTSSLFYCHIIAFIGSKVKRVTAPASHGGGWRRHRCAAITKTGMIRNERAAFFLDVNFHLTAKYFLRNLVLNLF